MPDHASCCGVARSCPGSDIGVEAAFCVVAEHPGVAPCLVRPDVEVEGLVPSWVGLNERVFVMSSPGGEVVRGGEADALDASVFGAAGARVEQVPATVVIDDAARPGRV